MKRKVITISNCPSCDSELERVNDQLFCRNAECESTRHKKVIHFAKTRKIKGLGEKTIEKLNLETINDIYNIESETIIEIMGDKLGNKLINEIEFSKRTTLEAYLPAFSIRLIGNSAAKKLAKYVDQVEDITFDVCKTAGLGDIATQSLLTWIEHEYRKYNKLPIELIASAKPSTKSQNIKVCITGKLDDYSSRSLATSFLEDKGVQVVSGVSKSLNYLINEDNKTSSKLSKAQEYGIPVITIKKLTEEIIK